MLSGPSRRSFVRGSLAALGTSALSLPALCAYPPAVPAKRFSDAIGICAHPNWRTPLWAETNWEEALIDSGVMHIRGEVGRGRDGLTAVAKLREFFARGGKVCILVEDQRSRLGRDGTQANIEFAANEVGSQHISGIESANEYNNPRTRHGNWATELREFQRWLHASVRSDPRLESVPTVAPSIWSRITNDYSRLGNLEPHVDKGCLHYYTAGLRPTLTPRRVDIGGGVRLRTSSLAQALEDAKILAPHKPQWMTEFGYPIAGPRLPLSPFFITEIAAAKYLLRGLFDAFFRGVERVYIYSLLDDVHRDPPRYHGLIDGRTLAPRKTFSALKNLMNLFTDTETHTGRAPNGLKYSLNLMTDGLRHQSFEMSDGTHLLVMYQDVDSYDRAAFQDVDVIPVNVRLDLPQRCDIEIFTPTFGAAPVRRVGDARSVTIAVGDHVSVAKIVPRMSLIRSGITAI